MKQLLKPLLSGITATVLILIAAAASAQVPMSPSTTASPSGAAAATIKAVPPAPMAETAPSKRPKRAQSGPARAARRPTTSPIG